MTREEWMLAFNRWLTERMESIDDDVFLQVSTVERHLLAWGTLPEKPADLARVYKAVAVYQQAIADIGSFPETGGPS